jgi:hypothetical protein
MTRATDREGGWGQGRGRCEPGSWAGLVAVLCRLAAAVADRLRCFAGGRRLAGLAVGVGRSVPPAAGCCAEPDRRSRSPRRSATCVAGPIVGVGRRASSAGGWFNVPVLSPAPRLPDARRPGAFGDPLAFPLFGQLLTSPKIQGPGHAPPARGHCPLPAYRPRHQRRSTSQQPVDNSTSCGQLLRQKQKCEHRAPGVEGARWLVWLFAGYSRISGGSDDATTTERATTRYRYQSCSAFRRFPGFLARGRRKRI